MTGWKIHHLKMYFLLKLQELAASRSGALQDRSPWSAKKNFRFPYASLKRCRSRNPETFLWKVGWNQKTKKRHLSKSSKAFCWPKTWFFCWISFQRRCRVWYPVDFVFSCFSASISPTEVAPCHWTMAVEGSCAVKPPILQRRSVWARWSVRWRTSRRGNPQHFWHLCAKKPGADMGDASEISVNSPVEVGKCIPLQGLYIPGGFLPSTLVILHMFMALVYSRLSWMIN